MIPSPEYVALKALEKPTQSGPGDMWLCRRLGIVRVFNGHKRGSRRGTQYSAFHLYHWGKPAMWSHPSDWRDNDPVSSFDDPATRPQSEKWEYLGNLFELLPYSVLAMGEQQ